MINLFELGTGLGHLFLAYIYLVHIVRDWLLFMYYLCRGTEGYFRLARDGSAV